LKIAAPLVCLLSIIILAHGTEPLPAGAEQGSHLPPLGDGLGRVVPVPEGVAIARLTTTLFSAAVKPASLPPLHGWRLVQTRWIALK
jgi:hypothetical protein